MGSKLRTLKIKAKIAQQIHEARQKQTSPSSNSLNNVKSNMNSPEMKSTVEEDILDKTKEGEIFLNLLKERYSINELPFSETLLIEAWHQWKHLSSDEAFNLLNDLNESQAQNNDNNDSKGEEDKMED